MVKSVRYVSKAVCKRYIGPMGFTCCHLVQLEGSRNRFYHLSMLQGGSQT